MFSSAEINELMMKAVCEGQKCTSVETAYNVGALIVDNSRKNILSTGYSRELPGNTHAEECAIEKLLKAEPAIDMINTTLFTTMEPCSTRLSGKKSCTARILKAKIQSVVVGISEPPNFVEHCVGINELRLHGVNVKLVNDDLVLGFCTELNHHLTSS